MATIAQLQKEAKQAPKFVLTGSLNGETIYIGQAKGLFDIPLVTDVENAVKFSVGFDNPLMKCRAWAACSKIDLTVKYLS